MIYIVLLINCMATVGVIFFLLERYAPKIIKFTVVQDGVAPRIGSNEATCYDLFAREIEGNSKTKVTVKLGVCIEPPSGYAAKIYARSSITKTYWTIPNGVGIIDNDYRGELMAVFVNSATEPFPYKVGDRVAQLEIHKVEPAVFKRVEILTETYRGEGGFGSTGF